MGLASSGKIAIFASGSGSNFEAIVEQMTDGWLDGEVSLLVCDKSGAAVVDKAHNYGVPVFVFNPKNYEAKQQFEEEIMAELEKLEVEWIVLAGYMRLVGEKLLEGYAGRIVNIHPSLLPAFPGKDAIGQALEAGVKYTGVTVHYVDEGMDTGEIIEQEALRIRDGETKDSLQQRIQTIEHRLYPQTIQSVSGTDRK